MRTKSSYARSAPSPSQGTGSLNDARTASGIGCHAGRSRTVRRCPSMSSTMRCASPANASQSAGSSVTAGSRGSTCRPTSPATAPAAPLSATMPRTLGRHAPKSHQPASPELCKSCHAIDAGMCGRLRPWQSMPASPRTTTLDPRPVAFDGYVPGRGRSRPAPPDASASPQPSHPPRSNCRNSRHQGLPDSVTGVTDADILTA